MDLFQQQHPSIKVVLEPVMYAEKEAKYLQGFEQNTAPDIIRLHAFSLPLFSGKGYTLDLTPFLEKEGAAFLEPWYPLTLDLMKFDGKIRAMPGDYMVMILLYNTELFKAAGLDPAKPPKTWDEFLNLKAPEVLNAAPIPIKTEPMTTVWLSSWVISAQTQHPEEA